MMIMLMMMRMMLMTMTIMNMMAMTVNQLLQLQRAFVCTLVGVNDDKNDHENENDDHHDPVTMMMMYRCLACAVA